MLLTYRSFASVVGIVAALVSGIVLVSGIAATLFLLAERSPLRAAAALILTLIFTYLIGMLVPRVHVTLFDHDTPMVTIAQSTVFPTATYTVSTPDGARLATLRKSAFARLGRNRWTIDAETTGHAIEESLSRAMTRKLLGKFNRKYEANMQLEYSGLDAGVIHRRGADADTLELRNDLLDRRVAVALATLVLGAEP